MSARAAHGRRRRLPQRRQEHPRQPPGRRQRGGHRAPSPASPAIASGSPASGTGVAFELIDTGGIDLEDEAELARDVQAPGAAGDRRGRRGPPRRRRAAPGCGPATPSWPGPCAAPRAPVLVVANKADRPERLHLDRRVPRARARRAARRSRRRTASAPATCSTRSSSCSATRRRGARTTRRSGSP